MDDEIVTYAQAEQYVRELSYFPLNEIGTSSWFKQHEILQKLNMQAHRNVSYDTEEFVSELIQTYNQFDLLLKQLFTHQILRKYVLDKLLKMNFTEEDLLKAQIYLYSIRFSEAVILDLLAVRIVDQLFESKYIPELIDYVAEQLNQVISNDYLFDYKEQLTDLNLKDELLFSASDIDFKRNCASFTVLRGLSCQNLDVSSTYRLKSNRIQVKTAQILGLNPIPWVRSIIQNKKITQIEIFENLEWKKFDEIAELQFKLFQLPAQLWISLLGLARLHDNFSSVEIDAFGAIKSKISDAFIDQIPQLKDVKLYYEKLVLNQQQTELQTHQQKVHTEFGSDEFLQKPTVIEVVSDILTQIKDQVRAKYEVKNTQIQVESNETGIQLSGQQTYFSDEKLFEEMCQIQLKRVSQFDMNQLTIVDQFDKVYPSCFCGQIARNRCSKCKKVWYCSRECQVKDWKNGHKAVCGKAKEEREIDQMMLKISENSKK